MKTNHEPPAAHVAPVPRISLNADDAAKALGISKRQLLAIRDAGELPFIQAGGQTFLFDPQDLAEWLRKKKQTKGGDNNGEHLN
jgi:excisionase family DNA binding protein